MIEMMQCAVDGSTGDEVLIRDISALRHERDTRAGHQMLAHLRTEAYPVYRAHGYPEGARPASALSFEENLLRIQDAKRRRGKTV